MVESVTFCDRLPWFKLHWTHLLEGCRARVTAVLSDFLFSVSLKAKSVEAPRLGACYWLCVSPETEAQVEAKRLFFPTALLGFDAMPGAIPGAPAGAVCDAPEGAPKGAPKGALGSVILLMVKVLSGSAWPSRRWTPSPCAFAMSKLAAPQSLPSRACHVRKGRLQAGKQNQSMPERQHFPKPVK